MTYILSRGLYSFDFIFSVAVCCVTKGHFRLDFKTILNFQGERVNVSTLVQSENSTSNAPELSLSEL